MENEFLKYEVVGFDLDGTLYDEFDFISQCYDVISSHLKKYSSTDKSIIFDFMKNKWLEKGSSYPHIFEETIKLFCEPNKDKNLIDDSLFIYRTFKPNLKLSVRVEYFLKKLSKTHLIFIVTDGNKILQRNKIESLKLKKYFNEDHIYVLGDYGSNYYKPNTKIIDKMKFMTNHREDKVLFLGDRQADRQFAINCNFNFKLIKYFI